MFNPHQDDPEGIVPVNRHAQGHRPDDFVDARSHRVAIRLDLSERWPVVVGLVQIIPRHFIDAHGEHGFEARIDPLVGDLGDDQFIDIERCRVPEVEDQRVPERFGTQVEGFVRSQRLVELFVQSERGVEVPANLLAFLFGSALIEQRGPGASQIDMLQIHRPLHFVQLPRHDRDVP